MKKGIGKLEIVIAIAVLLLSNFCVNAASEKYANRMNVVFVMDASGSMKNTDGQGWRYEAVDLFLGLATNSGNYMGAVVFNDEIILRQDMQGIDGMESKTALSAQIRQAAVTGDTDIGKAIEQAVQMLDENRNPNLPSAVILLSDGNTDLPAAKGAEGLKKSQESKSNAIEAARQNDYPIYCVCLNANNGANPVELQEVANATGGVFVEVKNAEDLKSVFNQFYSLIYSTDTIILADGKIPESGELEISFEVPEIGVEEANIIIRSLNENTAYTVFRPNQIAFTEDELNGMRITAQTFSVIKISEPESGEWKLLIRGVPGDDVKIDMVYNADYEVKVNDLTGQSSTMGDTIRITAVLTDAGIPVEDEEIYRKYPAKLVVTDPNDGTVKTVEMEADAAEYWCDYPLDEYGTWEAKAVVSVGGMEASSAAVTIKSGNTPPVWVENPIKIKNIVTPFGEEILEKDLAEYVADRQDSELSYIISDSDYDDSVVYIQKGNLCIRIRDCKKGSLKISAVDSQGDALSATVEIVPVSLVGILITILATIAVLLLVLLITRRIVQGNKKFNGEIMVVSFDYEEGETGVPQTLGPVKGKVPLFRYLSEASGIDIQTAFFTATGKDYIWFEAKDGYYSSVNPDAKSKKIRLDGDIEVTISKNSDLESGIRVTYMPFRI